MLHRSNLAVVLLGSSPVERSVTVLQVKICITPSRTTVWCFFLQRFDPVAEMFSFHRHFLRFECDRGHRQRRYLSLASLMNKIAIRDKISRLSRTLRGTFTERRGSSMMDDLTARQLRTGLDRWHRWWAAVPGGFHYHCLKEGHKLLC